MAYLEEFFNPSGTNGARRRAKKSLTPSKKSFLIICASIYISISYSECSTPPKIKPFSFPKVASKGEKISVVCLVSEGTPPFSFSWSKEGRELQTTDNVKVQAVPEYSVAFINSIDERSAGNYTCIVKNIFGFDSYSAYLDVEGILKTAA
ncbi:pro-neuregulin-2, membrane-bound isoform-like [Haemaphysalis longicornis]